MYKILWLGNPFFSPDLPDLGWDLVYYAPKPGEVLDWEDCLRLADGPPDLLVAADMSRPPFLIGQESFACPTVFYAVDTHIHSWMPFYAQSFDACLVSLKDDLDKFRNLNLAEDRLVWSPPYALNETTFGREEERLVPCGFVGTVDAEKTPLRFRFFGELKKLVPGLLVQWGSFTKLYPTFKTTINFCEHGDLNFRVFESLGCGVALVTPALGQGQDLLFRAGEDLLTYEPPRDDSQAEIERSANSAAALIAGLLADDARRIALSKSGYNLVDHVHRRRNRAMTFSLFAQSRLLQDREAVVAARQAKAAVIHDAYLKMLYLHWAENSPDDEARSAYLRAAKNVGGGRVKC